MFRFGMFEVKAKAKARQPLGQGQGQTASRPRPWPRIFVLEVSSRSRTVLEDSIPAIGYRIRDRRRRIQHAPNGEFWDMSCDVTHFPSSSLGVGWLCRWVSADQRSRLASSRWYSQSRKSLIFCGVSLLPQGDVGQLQCCRIWYSHHM